MGPFGLNRGNIGSINPFPYGLFRVAAFQSIAASRLLLPGDTKIDRFPAPGDFHAGRFQNFQEILKGGGGLLQGGVNSLPDLVLKG